MIIRNPFRRGNYREKLMANLKAYYTGLAMNEIDEMLVNDAFDEIELDIQALKETLGNHAEPVSKSEYGEAPMNSITANMNGLVDAFQPPECKPAKPE